MKLHFEPDLDYQHDAIEAVCDLFRGQEINRTAFTVLGTSGGAGQLSLVSRSFAELQSVAGLVEGELGVGNRLALAHEDILRNLQAVQLRNGLTASTALNSLSFTAEMETGTGKTYVYLRTIFELNKRYGFAKFVIVVPSIAIKEGVYKTLQITEDHFKSLYSGQPFEYFIYDTGKLGQVTNFAASPYIQIMLVTVGAINKKEVNNLYKDSEKTGGQAPIDLIRATNPVVIVDEPQSVDGGLQGSGKQALDAMYPLCTLRYSATHLQKYHMVYRLDAVDAYERKLVKRIEIASLGVEGGHNKPYLRFLSVNSKRGTLTATIDVDKQEGVHVRRRTVAVQDGDFLEELTRRAIYSGVKIGEIRAGADALLEVKTNDDEQFLAIGQAIGDVDADSVKRQMIRMTILEHLRKELRLAPMGIKVLSLFFVDEVARYRSYDAGGRPVKGTCATMFEEEYRRAIKLPEFHGLFEGIDIESLPEEVHDGYFSIDKNRHWTDTTETNQPGRDGAERAYNLIMRDKERLLGFSSKLKFIFSHSALREGWDNPNVFQICALRDIGTERERRQTIGRGLRLCVNQSGERVRDPEVNTLTVVATESYESFAENLQKEIERDTGIQFGVIEKHQFANISIMGADGNRGMLGFDASAEIYKHLRDESFIDASGKVQDKLRFALRDGSFYLPAELGAYRELIETSLRRISGRFKIRNADDRRVVKTRQAVLESEEFRSLWERINGKTTYRVHFDNDKLIRQCVEAIDAAPPIPRTRLSFKKADLQIGVSGVEAIAVSAFAPVVVDESDVALPDIITELQDRTQLTRRSLVAMLTKSRRLFECRRNPQAFVDMISETVNRAKRLALIDGIRYQRIGKDNYYAQELFERVELVGYLGSMLLNARKSVYEDVVCDSAAERGFAEQLELNTAVKVYSKLPSWFTVMTPLGSYNPDWAVLVQDDEHERLYFVVETKGSLFSDDLRDKEGAKVACGTAHFRALADGENPARFVKATSIEDLWDNSIS